MIQFDEIKKQICLNKLNKIEKDIDRQQLNRCKIIKKYSLNMYEENNYTYLYLLDRYKYWKKENKQNFKDFVKFIIGGTVVVAVMSAPFAIVGKQDDAAKLFLMLEGFGTCVLGTNAMSVFVTYNGYKKQVRRATQYLKREYRPIKKCDERIKKLDDKKARINNILSEMHNQENVLTR